MMRRWGRCAAGALTAAALLLCATQVFAEGRSTNAFRSCRSYKSGDQFVRQSAAYCLKSGDSTICERKAQRYFEYCGFAGDYREISQKVYKKLLVMFMITQARDVSQINSR